MSERCERTSERTSEWPSTYVSILVCSRPQCVVGLPGKDQIRGEGDFVAGVRNGAIGKTDGENLQPTRFQQMDLVIQRQIRVSLIRKKCSLLKSRHSQYSLTIAKFMGPVNAMPESEICVTADKF